MVYNTSRRLLGAELQFQEHKNLGKFDLIADGDKLRKSIKQLAKKKKLEASNGEFVDALEIAADSSDDWNMDDLVQDYPHRKEPDDEWQGVSSSSFKIETITDSTRDPARPKMDRPFCPFEFCKLFLSAIITSQNLTCI